MNDSIHDIRSRLATVKTSVQSRIPPAWSQRLHAVTRRARLRLAEIRDSAHTRMPLIHTLLSQVRDGLRHARDWLGGIDLGARTVQAVGAAVVLGGLYVAIWGVGHQPTPQAPEVVAARVAPIGTLTLKEPAAPQVAEQISPVDRAASAL